MVCGHPTVLPPRHMTIRCWFATTVIVEVTTLAISLADILTATSNATAGVMTTAHHTSAQMETSQLPLMMVWLSIEMASVDWVESSYLWEYGSTLQDSKSTWRGRWGDRVCIGLWHERISFNTTHSNCGCTDHLHACRESITLISEASNVRRRCAYHDICQYKLVIW